LENLQPILGCSIIRIKELVIKMKAGNEIVKEKKWDRKGGKINKSNDTLMFKESKTDREAAEGVPLYIELNSIRIFQSTEKLF